MLIDLKRIRAEMKVFNCLRILPILLLTLSEIVLADVPEYSKQESETSARHSHLAATDSGVYAVIVFGAQQLEPDIRSSFAIREATSDSVESAVRYGKSVEHNAPTEAAKAEPMIDGHATSWWAMLLTAIGLIFYQIRRPVRPRIGTR